MVLESICNSKGFLAGAGGSGALALMIIFVFLIPNYNANAESITDLQIEQAEIIVHLDNNKEIMQGLESHLDKMDDKLDKLTIITCKNSDSSLCN